MSKPLSEETRKYLESEEYKKRVEESKKYKEWRETYDIALMPYAGYTQTALSRPDVFLDFFEKNGFKTNNKIIYLDVNYGKKEIRRLYWKPLPIKPQDNYSIDDTYAWFVFCVCFERKLKEKEVKHIKEKVKNNEYDFKPAPYCYLIENVSSARAKDFFEDLTDYKQVIRPKEE